MSEASELLAGLSASEYASYSDIAPVDDYLNINAEGRITNVPGTEILLGVETDQDVERKYFKCPRIVGDNIDLSTLSLRIHYQNAGGEKDKYPVGDVKIEGEYITFSWLLSEKVLRYQGDVQFTVVAVKALADGTVKNAWNTTLAKGKVLEGLPVDDLDYVEEEQARDVLAQLLVMLDDKTQEGIIRIETHADEQINLISFRASEVLDSIPQEYQDTIDAVNQNGEKIYDLQRTKAGAIVEEVVGDVIHVKDAAEQPPVCLQLLGMSKQNQSNGYQVYNGRTTNAKNDDGSITTTWNNTGVQDDAVHSNINTNPFLLTLECGDVFTNGGFLSFESTLDVGVEVVVQLRMPSGATNWSKEVRHTIKKGLNKVVLPEYSFTEGQTGVGIQIRRHNVTTIGTWTFTLSKFFVKAGQEEAEYEVYTGMMPGPNPEWPQEISSVGDTTIYLRGANLIPKVYHDGVSKTMEGITFTVLEDGSVLVNGTSTALSYFTFNATNQRKVIPNGWLSTHTGLEYGADVQMQNDIYIDGEYKTSVQTVNEYSYKREFYGNVELGACRIKVNAGVTVNNVVVYPMLCSGEAVAPYERSKIEQSLSTNSNLSGNPTDEYTAADANYVDQNGEKYIVNYRDFVRGVDVINVKSANLVDYFDKYCTQASNTTYSDTILRFDFGYAFGCKVKSIVLCNRFKYAFAHGNDNTIVRTHEGISSHSMSDIISVFIDKSRLTTPDLAGFKAYLQANETIVQYVLAAPEEIAIPADEVEAYRELLMNEPTSLLYNSTGAQMKLLYAADTKTYVESHGGGGGGSINPEDLAPYAKKEDVEAAIGDIETALDEIITLQEALIGGDA